MRILPVFSRFLLAACCGAGAVVAQSQPVTIITSFPKDLTEVYRRAFETRNPGVKVEVLNRGTSAAIAFVREAPAGNRPDVFWASAPDAFEVLAKEKLLEKYEGANPAVPAKIGTYPINDPQGFYYGQALAGYGVGDGVFQRAGLAPLAGRADGAVRADLIDEPVDLEIVAVRIREFHGDLTAGAPAALEVNRDPVFAEPGAGPEHFVEAAHLEGEVVQAAPLARVGATHQRDPVVIGVAPEEDHAARHHAVRIAVTYL